MDKHFFIKTEEEKPFNSEGVCSLIDNDFVLNYLNDFDHKNQKNTNSLLHSNFPSTNNLQHFYESDNHYSLNFDKNSFRQHDNEIFENNTKLEENKNEFDEKIENPKEKIKKNRKSRKSRTNEKPQKIKKNNSKKEIENIKKLKEIHENEELFNYRNNIKNTYINKINSLMTNTLENNQISIESPRKYSQSSSDSSEKSPLKKQCEKNKSTELDRLHKKLEKNRESARNSRKRKKIYIEVLENKVAELSSELHSTKKSLEFNIQQLQKMQGHTKHLNNLIQMKQQIYTKMGKITSSTIKDENEINLLLDSLRLRLGATGKERVAAVDSLFKQISEIIVPGYIRFLLCLSIYDQDLIKSEKEINFDTDLLNGKLMDLESQKNLLTELNVTDKQKHYLMKLQKRFITENSKIKSAFENLESSRKMLEKIMTNLENLFDDMRNNFTPSQITKFLLFVEREKKRKAFYLAKFWDAGKLWPENESDFSDFSDIINETEDLNFEKEERLKKERTRKKIHLNDK